MLTIYHGPDGGTMGPGPGAAMGSWPPPNWMAHYHHFPTQTAATTAAHQAQPPHPHRQAGHRRDANQGRGLGFTHASIRRRKSAGRRGALPSAPLDDTWARKLSPARAGGAMVSCDIVNERATRRFIRGALCSGPPSCETAATSRQLAQQAQSRNRICVTREIEASADRTPVLQKGPFFTDFWYRRR
jgi:hypothetical protein